MNELHGAGSQDYMLNEIIHHYTRFESSLPDFDYHL